MIIPSLCKYPEYDYSDDGSYFNFRISNAYNNLQLPTHLCHRLVPRLLNGGKKGAWIKMFAHVLINVQNNI